MEKFKKVEVEWFDAQSSLESLTIEEIREELVPIYSTSCGFLVHEEKGYIVLGFLLFGNGMVKHHQVIPREMIRKIKVLR